MQDQTVTHATPESQVRAQESTGWQTPDFTVVDTAMEITAYALSTK
ncbi:pyrroloquinoline quinone precursor peptide PqqA [Streptomyces sp. NPDC102360]